MKESTRLRKKIILETYRKDFPNVNFNDYSASVTIYDNGRIGMGYADSIKFGKKEESKNYLPLGNGTFIHESLIGIDDNNGWTRIEPDGSNLPESGDFRVCNNNPDIIFASSNDRFDYEDVVEMFEDGSITHYKPITPELKPIY